MRINRLFLIILTVFVLGNLFIFLKPQKQNLSIQSNSSKILPSYSTSSTQSATFNTKIFELTIKSKKLISGLDVLKVNEGDDILIKITSDEAEELHLHGFDKSINLKKDIPGELSFSANLTGRFPFELEKSKTEIGILEVQPK